MGFTGIKKGIEGVRKKMRITIENYPEKYLEMIYTAGRNCYGTRDAAKKIGPKVGQQMNKGQMQLQKFTAMLVKRGHESVLEHICVSVYAKDVSRSFLAQITRHRLVSYSVKSQHYVKHNDFRYKDLEDYGSDNPIVVKAIYDNLMRYIDRTYQNLMSYGIPNYIAREVLPNACLTDMYMTANVREWKHIIRMRIGKENTPEIRAFAKTLLRELYILMPEIFEDLRDKYFKAGE